MVGLRSPWSVVGSETRRATGSQGLQSGSSTVGRMLSMMPCTPPAPCAQGAEAPLEGRESQLSGVTVRAKAMRHAHGGGRWVALAAGWALLVLGGATGPGPAGVPPAEMAR